MTTLIFGLTDGFSSQTQQQPWNANGVAIGSGIAWTDSVFSQQTGESKDRGDDRNAVSIVRPAANQQF